VLAAGEAGCTVAVRPSYTVRRPASSSDVIGTVRTARGGRLWGRPPRAGFGRVGVRPVGGLRPSVGLRTAGGSGTARPGAPELRNSGRCRRRGAQPRGVGGAGWDGRSPWSCPLPGGAIGALPRGLSDGAADGRSALGPLSSFRTATQ